MNHYLIVFDRARGELVSMQLCATARVAMKARFQAERHYRDRPDIEIVVLGARSEEALRSTHARYFSGVKDLIGLLRPGQFASANSALSELV